MFVPIGDDNPLKTIRFQYVTVGLIVVNIIAFLLEGTGGSEQDIVASFAVVPQELYQVGIFGGPAPFSGDALAIPERATLFSYMFLHGDIMHLIGNMLFLWVFGDNVEDALGHGRYLAFYLACGVAAALAHAFMLPNSQEGLIGASGAVSGVIAAYLMMHPRVNVWVLVFKIIPLRITAAIALGLWIVFQFAMALMPAASGEAVATAWWAHIGGLIAGALLILVLRPSRVPLSRG